MAMPPQDRAGTTRDTNKNLPKIGLVVLEISVRTENKQTNKQTD